MGFIISLHYSFCFWCLLVMRLKGGSPKETHACRFPWRREDCFISSGARVTEDCESPDMSVGNWTLDIRKNGTSFKLVSRLFLWSNHSTFSQPSFYKAFWNSDLRPWPETAWWLIFWENIVVLTSTPPTRILLSKVEFKNFWKDQEMNKSYTWVWILKVFFKHYIYLKVV